MGPSGGVSAPNRLTSALLHGRSLANALPATNHVRWPWRTPSVTAGSAAAIRATSSIVATPRTVLRRPPDACRERRGATDDLHAVTGPAIGTTKSQALLLLLFWLF